MSADSTLGVRGHRALAEDRKSEYPLAPKAPDLMNVDRKTKSVDDSDNYRNDLLKNFCTKDVNNSGRLSGTNLLDPLKEYGKNGTRNRERILNDMNKRIEQMASDAGDGANQIKYLLCQQADSYIAPPRPKGVQEGSPSANLLNRTYLGKGNWPNWFFAILAFGLIFFSLWKNKGRANFYVLLVLSIIFFILVLILLFQDRCLPGTNRYYDPEEPDPFKNTVLVLMGASLGLGLISLGIGKYSGNSTMMLIGTGLIMILALSTDMLFALFQPQVFILLVLIIRMILWMFRNSVPQPYAWNIPTVSLVDYLSSKLMGIAMGTAKNSNVPNEVAFGWINKLKNGESFFD